MTEKSTYTMKDIARELGVSVATVSRALKDSPRISQEQRERIKAFAREHNFYPNAIAESLRQSKTRPSTLIGVIIPQINHYYFSSILAGIEEQANVRGYSVVVAQSGEQYEREVRICESFMHSRVCGVIVSQARVARQAYSAGLLRPDLYWHKHQPCGGGRLYGSFQGGQLSD